MPYSASAGLAIALASASTVVYPLTDHNRQPIRLDYEIIEKSNRMADGTLRKYVVARKKRIGVAWQMIPSGTGSVSNSSVFKNQNYTHTVDGFKGGAWMKDFYENNLFVPMILTITHSRDTASANAASAFYPSPAITSGETMNCYISNFSYEVVKRYAVTDYVNVTMEFTEI